MTLKSLQSMMDKLPYDIVVFDANSFPRELLYYDKNNVVRYAKSNISKPYLSITIGWYTTAYDYHKHDNVLSILYTDYNSFISKKLRLLSKLKDFT